jgi:hypothetical protein
MKLSKFSFYDSSHLPHISIFNGMMKPLRRKSFGWEAEVMLFGLCWRQNNKKEE